MEQDLKDKSKTNPKYMVGGRTFRDMRVSCEKGEEIKSPTPLGETFNKLKQDSCNPCARMQKSGEKVRSEKGGARNT